ncbi:hypothetical protein VV01_18830 [Luteipulveratus halotolerans]|uniref:2OG-Fe dioxygenase family protein n=1 Tax=Luteipulveratus halotolerans TaxID=1631356 RepID=A0A0L6CM68_9MICO|nr:hypothetical protein VV01_18830 [Luteipulveratus halotolerans]
MINGRIEWESEATFEQAADINAYAGGQKRSFAPIRSDVLRDVVEVVDHLREDVIGVESDALIGAHQIRVIAGDGVTGLPAPEGVHQDGFDIVATCVIGLTNVSGGVTTLTTDAAGQHVVAQESLGAREYAAFDDRALFHYVSPVNALVPGQTHRDVLVLTFTLI